MEERLAQVIKEQKARIEEGDTFPMEFVGRSRELAGLQSLWREAHTGLTRTAVVTGPSGIGKTRLAQELLSYVTGQEVRTVALKGTRAGMKLRWGVASDLVREALRLPGSAGISPASDSILRAMLPSLGKGAIDLRAVNGMSPAAFLDAVSDLLEAVSFESPLVVLIDDFQWLDRNSRTLFMGLASRCRELRVLFLILGRSDLSSRHWDEVETTLVAEAGARRFLLEPLIEEEVGELLALGAAFPNPEDARGAVGRIHQASAGNPLFIREILKELHEKGILVRDGPGWVFKTSEIPEAFELPENLRVLLQERLDRLSEAAANVAATLARANRRMAPDDLQRETQLPKGVFGKAVAELLERGVIEWVDGTALDFVHDLLRDTATAHLSGSLPDASEAPSFLRAGRGVVAAGVFFLAIVLSVLWWTGNLPGVGSPLPPRYGGGVLLLKRQTLTPIQYRVTHESPAGWEPRPLPVPGSGDPVLSFSDHAGGFHHFGVFPREDGPDLARFLDDGTMVPIFPGPGDQVLHDMSPDRGRILFASENVGSRPYSQSLFVGNLASGTRQVIYRGFGHVQKGRWAPDGDLLAFTAIAESDTLALYSVLGERIGATTVGDVSGLTWCGSDLVVATSIEGEGYLLGVSTPELAVDTLMRLDPGSSPTCSPDGTALALRGVRNRRLTPMIIDLETGETHDLNGEDLQTDRAFWMPTPPRPTPVEVRIPKDTIRMNWGEETNIDVSVILSDGTQARDGVRWEALDPAIASMGPYGELTGNGVGTAGLVARWGYSLLDTVMVQVLETGDGGQVFQDDFATLDTMVWRTVGAPPPRPVEVDGSPALQLTGNEKYTDGLIRKQALSLDQGLTIEFEFKLEVTEEVHQNIMICLRDIDWDRSDLETGTFFLAGEACVRYPALEHQKMDPSEISVTVSPGRERYFRAPEALPNDGWVHLALQVRADGLTTGVVDRRRQGENPVALLTDPTIDWHLVLGGTVLGTELYIRNLIVWQGERY
jgi:hypothetical protein